MRWQKWGDVYRDYLARGHDHGSAAFAADQWVNRGKHGKEKRQKDRERKADPRRPIETMSSEDKRLRGRRILSALLRD